MGSLFLKEFKQSNKEFVVVDYNPEIIRALINKKIPCIYGDFVNNEILDKIDVKNSKMIISTIPDIEDNLLLIKKTREINPKVPIIVVANRISEALELYKAGASYVIIPQVIGAQRAFETIKKITKKGNIHKLKQEHLSYLKSIHRILY
jgi:voltage-gated potassium channel Kch